ncbi:uncharacterized protein LOC116618460 [Nematostella vectensis]|uniref:uncharacterized protein LOC116618460 n=1 Tax=Nematostella vectensis TaxID=45351 RepID=UPI0020770316|nr:uncharacterized protein LOC116618460 [Nematostella vectensis]XP_048581455.1 uncharacterized protein LOC116618460 [Nematostella vectensis]XP_048581456.1 uncharacterized protein LOC116618460 [Nematostella vectensis]XP_048581457.1 uncharacterized protein LOC116618460 [Nematostella vectensis]
MAGLFDFSRTGWSVWFTYFIVLIMIAITGFFILASIILTIKRFCQGLKQEGEAFDALPEEGDEADGGFKSFLQFLQRDKDYELVTVTKGVMGNYSHIGVRLEGGLDNPSLHGDPGIFVQAVKKDSPAYGKLYPGDRILSVNGERVTRVPRKYVEVMIKMAEGVVRFYVKRAPKRQKRVYKAMDEYNADVRKGVFTKQQFEEIEDAFSVFDPDCKGRVKTMDCVPLVRSLGYNLHEAEIWVYMNELGYTGNTKVLLTEFIKLMNLIVTEHGSFEDEILFAYSVFDPEDEGYISVEEFQKAFDRMSGRERIKDDEIDEIKRLGDKDGDGKLEFRDLRRLLLPTMKMY